MEKNHKILHMLGTIINIKGINLSSSDLINIDHI